MSQSRQRRVAALSKDMNERLTLRMNQLKASIIREDGRLERLCEHGVGHTVGHVDDTRLTERHIWTHGCDGCCAGYERQDGEVYGPLPESND